MNSALIDAETLAEHGLALANPLSRLANQFPVHASLNAERINAVNALRAYSQCKLHS